jgi:hypothetical protein
MGNFNRQNTKRLLAALLVPTIFIIGIFFSSNALNAGCVNAFASTAPPLYARPICGKISGFFCYPKGDFSYVIQLESIFLRG